MGGSFSTLQKVSVITGIKLHLSKLLLNGANPGKSLAARRIGHDWKAKVQQHAREVFSDTEGRYPRAITMLPDGRAISRQK
jgi:hypothetical protein